MARSSAISETELFWRLVDKADRKFSKVRDSPPYGCNRNEADLHKAFRIYTRLWKMQQESRQRLVEAGMKRWEIGEIASRIAQLYYGQYLRTSDSTYLSECYMFYEAVLTREYFRDGLSQEPGLAMKQLRFLARFVVVCLVLGRREMVARLAHQMRALVDECRKTFKEMDSKEWKLLVQEILRFLKADTAFMNMRPLRYSFVFDSHPDSLPYVVSGEAKRGLKLSDAILSSYHYNEIKFTELTLDTFRMIQCLEWEPSGSFSLSNQKESEKSAANNPLHDIRDPTLPPNPRKVILYRPPVTHFLVVIATIVDELSPNGILLLYLSARGKCKETSQLSSLSSSTCTGTDISSPWEMPSKLVSPPDSPPSTSEEADNQFASPEEYICLGSQGNEGVHRLYPSDLIPFTRKPLFLIVDGDSSYAFKAIHGAEKGETAAILLSPRLQIPSAVSGADSAQWLNQSQFTMFLTTPLQAFYFLLSIPTVSIDKETYGKAEKMLSSLLVEWGLILARSESLDPVWVEVLGDPFLRRLLLRFIFCRAVLELHVTTRGRMEFLPQCLPALPESVLPRSTASQSAILQLADLFGVTNHFTVEGTIPGSLCDRVAPESLDSHETGESLTAEHGGE